MDSLKEFRNMFLERYLEKNKIGRKSISRSISKQQRQPKSLSNLKLSKSFDAKLAKSHDDDFDDYNICKYFDFNSNTSSSLTTTQTTDSNEIKNNENNTKHLSVSFNLYNSSYNDSYLDSIKLNHNPNSSYETLDSDLAFSLVSAQSVPTSNNDEELFFKNDPTKNEEFYFQENENKNETIFDLNFGSAQMFISNYDDNNMKIFELDAETNFF